MEWRQTSPQMKSHEHDHRRFHSEISQVDLTLRLGFPYANGDESDSDHHNKQLISTALHNINHHPRQTQSRQVMVTDVGLGSSGGRNGEMTTSEANYNPHQILWSKEQKTYVLKSNNVGQLHQSSFGNHHQVKGIGSSATVNLAANNNNLPLQNNSDLYTLLNPAAASRITDHNDQEAAETSSSGRRKGSRRRKVSNCNDVEKRCTNYNCNTNFTPMWRKGPLGPKSLCNACGIRYRKEIVNREAMAAENSHS